MAFDAHQYFEELCTTNKKATEENFKFCRVSGISHMEEVIQNFSKEKAYFCIDDTADGSMMQHSGGGYFERRQYTVFLLKKYPYGDMEKQHIALNQCREIFWKLVKKLIYDRRRLENEMTYLNVDRIPFYEVPGYYISGCTGLYFMVTIDIPTELCYDSNEWK